MPARVVIIGGGTMGLACAAYLAERGAKVTLLERYSHLHELGSHGGHTRVTRLAYHEGSAYVPLIRESEACWEAMEREGGERVLVRCGLIESGSPDDPDMQEVLAACRAQGLEHAVYDAAETRARYGFRIPPSWIGCLTTSGGYVRVGAALDGLRRRAEAAGATLRYGARVMEVVPRGHVVRVLLESGELLPCDHLVVCAGAWVPTLLSAELRRIFAVRRRVLAWSAPPIEARARLGAMPVWAVFDRRGMFYGFPYNEEGIAGFKLACHVYHQPDDPPGLRADDVDREIHGADLAPLAGFLEEYLPEAAGPWAASKICLYGCTPSGDYVVDRHPEDWRIILAAGFSGHGFKVAPAIGRLVADMVTHGDAADMPAIFGWAHHRAGPGFP